MSVITKFYNLDTDNTLTNNNDTYIASQKAVKSYVDNGLSNKVNTSLDNIDTITIDQVTLATVAITGDYDDLINQPTIPTTAADVGAVASNNAITGATKCKITYDSKGLVTAGADLVASDIPDLSATYLTGINSSDVMTALGYTPANDSNVVKTDGNQTIGGTKTFTSPITATAQTATDSAAYLEVFRETDSNLDSATNPTYSKTYYMAIKDINARYLGYISSTYETDGSSTTQIVARTRNTGDTDNVTQGIGIVVERDGTTYTFAPTPATSDSSTKIATTAFVQSEISTTLGNIETLLHNINSGS